MLASVLKEQMLILVLALKVMSMSMDNAKGFIVMGKMETVTLMELFVEYLVTTLITAKLLPVNQVYVDLLHVLHLLEKVHLRNYQKPFPQVGIMDVKCHMMIAIGGEIMGTVLWTN